MKFRIMVVGGLCVVPVLAIGQLSKTVDVSGGGQKFETFSIPEGGLSLELQITTAGSDKVIDSIGVYGEDGSDTVQWVATTPTDMCVTTPPTTPALYKTHIFRAITAPVFSSREWVWINGTVVPCNATGPGGGAPTTIAFDVDVPAPDIDIEHVAEENEESVGGFVCVGTNCLVKVTINKVEPSGRNSGTVTLTGTGIGTKIKLWQRADRTGPIASGATFSTPDSLPTNIWVEAIAASDTLRDVELKASYTTDGKTTEDKVKVTAVKAQLDVYNAKNGSKLSEADKDANGALLLVNEDDDNHNLVPDNDTSEGTVTGEDDLARIDLNLLPAMTAGSLTLEAVAGASKVKVWKNAGRGTSSDIISLPRTWSLSTETFPKTFWVEGISNSSTEGDRVRLRLRYQMGGICSTDVVSMIVVAINRGNAVYREGAIVLEGWVGHAGIFYDYVGPCTRTGLADANLYYVIHHQSPIIMGTMNDFLHYPGHPFWVACRNPSMTASDRLKVRKTAWDILGRAGSIGWVFEDVLEPDSWVGTVAGISALRCDGIPEVSYELNSVPVWGRLASGPTHYNIHTYLSEHNEYSPTYNGTKHNLAPVTQCGNLTPVGATTTFSTGTQPICIPVTLGP